MTFCIELAGTAMKIHSIYDDMYFYCKGYLTEKEPKYEITVTADDLEKERSYNADAPENIPEPYLELLAAYRNIAETLLEEDTFLFHGSVVSVGGEAYLFAAPSGTGKSTHTRLWRQMLGDKAVMVNDDKPLLKIEGDQVLACGTPWNGKHRLGNNIQVPLKAICLLERGKTNRIRTISFEEAYPVLLQQTYRPSEQGELRKTLELVDLLKGRVSFYRLTCTMDPEAAEIAYEGMNR